MSSKIKRLLTWVAIATAAGLKATPLAEGLKNEPASQKIQGTIRLVTQRRRHPACEEQVEYSESKDLFA